MIYLIKKNIRDFFELKAEFFSTFLLAFIGLFAFSGLTAAWSGMDVEFQNYQEKNNLADLWINVTDSTNSQLSQINSLSGVEQTQLNKNVKVSSYLNSANKELLIILPSDNKISVPHTIEGKKFETDQDGLWINQQFAEENNLKINDNMVISYNENKLNAKIKGIIISPDFISYNGSGNELMPNNIDYGYAYASERFLQTLAPSYNTQLTLTTKSGLVPNSMKEKIENILGNNYLNLLSRDNYSGVTSYTDKAQTLKKLSVVFSIVFLLLAILTIQTTMRRLVTNQQVIIGSMKAIGIRNIEIYVHYSMYGFIVTFFGGGLGIIMAPIIAEFVLKLQAESYSMPNWRSDNSPITFVIFGLIICIGTLTALFASKTAIKGLPAEVLRPKTVFQYKKSLLETFPNFWKKLSFGWQWVLRDVSRSKNKTIIGVVGIVGSMLLMIASFGLQDSLTRGNETTYGKQYTYKNKSMLENNLSDEQLKLLKSEINNQGQFVSENAVELNSATKSSMAVLTVVNEGLFMNLLDENGNLISLNINGAVVTKRMADELGVKKNSYVNIRITGKKDLIPVQIKDITYVSSPQGIFLSDSMWSKLNQKFQPTALLTGEKLVKSQLERNSFITYVTTLEKQKSDANEVMKGVSLVIIILSIFAITLTAIVLYNLGSLNLTERYRDYATMKVLGFRRREINSIILKDSFLNLGVGWILSIPLGLLFLKAFVSLGSSNTFEIFPYISFGSLFIITGIMLIGTLFISLIISSKVNKINMIDALKSVE